MNDKELLELAAKAAGIEYDVYGNDFYIPEGEEFQRPWNPLTDDEDALRLAVKLRIEIYIHENDTQCIGPNLHRAIETHEDDPEAATRRAIVRAAAEIGRGME